MFATVLLAIFASTVVLSLAALIIGSILIDLTDNEAVTAIARRSNIASLIVTVFSMAMAIVTAIFAISFGAWS